MAGEAKFMPNDFIVCLSSRLVHAQQVLTSWSAGALDVHADISTPEALEDITIPSERELIKKAIIRENIDQALEELDRTTQNTKTPVYVQEDIDQALEDLAQKEHAASLDPEEVGAILLVASTLEQKNADVANNAGETVDEKVTAAQVPRKGLGTRAKNWFFCVQASAAEPKAAKSKALKALKPKSAAPAA